MLRNVSPGCRFHWRMVAADCIDSETRPWQRCVYAHPSDHPSQRRSDLHPAEGSSLPAVFESMGGLGCFKCCLVTACLYGCDCQLRGGRRYFVIQRIRARALVDRQRNSLFRSRDFPISSISFVLSLSGCPCSEWNSELDDADPAVSVCPRGDLVVSYRSSPSDERWPDSLDSRIGSRSGA